MPATRTVSAGHRVERGLWSGDEHDKFLEGLKLYPRGPWKKIAGHVGTRSARQVQTHAQKYYEKVSRRLRGLRKDRKKLVRPEHRLDDDMIKLCRLASNKEQRQTLSSYLHGPLSPTRELSKALEMQTLSDPVKPELSEFQAEQSFEAMLSKLQIQVNTSVYFGGSDCSDPCLDLSDFDDSCVDYLIEVLDSAPDYNSDGSIDC